MPKAGDKFLTHTYQNWGEYTPKRDSRSRTEIPCEAYIVVPQEIARRYDIYMSNNSGANVEYDAYDQEGNHICVLKAQGNVKAGEKYAKQFSGSKNLKALTSWINNYCINDEDDIEVEFISSNSLRLTKV